MQLDYYIFGDSFKSLNYNERFQYFDTHDFWNIYRFIITAKRDPTRNYTLVTHNSDWPVSRIFQECGMSQKDLPDNIYWFAQNVDVDDSKIETIPIGLENRHWHPSKMELLDRTTRRSKVITHLCCALFSTKTHPYRRDVYNHFNQFDWCLCLDTVNGKDVEQYYDIIDSCMFTICPRGNGIDTHRIWEAIYLGSIPVIEECVNTEYYEKLPSLIVENLLDVDRSTLEKHSNYYHKPNDISRWKTTEFKYWEHRIYNKANR